MHAAGSLSFHLQQRQQSEQVTQLWDVPLVLDVHKMLREHRRIELKDHSKIRRQCRGPYSWKILEGTISHKNYTL